MPKISSGVRRAGRCALALTAAAALSIASVSAWGAASQAMGYEPKYPPGFSHFDYVNPDAPKGGALVLSSPGSFDTLNPFVLKDLPAGALDLLMFESLMAPSLDEPFSQYGLLADDVRLAGDGLSVTYHINSAARFSDGSPVTAADVKFSFDTLKSDKAHPRYRIFWADIKKAVVVDEGTVRFEFARVNPELHMIVGQIPIFSRNWVGKTPFNDVVLKPPVASGPYLIEGYELGKYITYKRNPDYWGKDLNVRRGAFNFERVTLKYYRDSTVALEGFKAGEFDFISVFNSKQWARDYVGSKFDDGLIRKTEFTHRNNAGMQGFVFNMRRPLFQDKRVRRAIGLAMDFHWANENLFYGQYQRCDSYFSNSELASSGLPEGDELVLLTGLRDQLPETVFTHEWEPSRTGTPGALRANLREAQRLLREAGWAFHDGLLRNKDGRPLSFEITLSQKGFERIVAPFARNLAKLGIGISYRTVDPALYQRKTDNFDFDMVVQVLPESQSPGNELMNMFHSSSAAQIGSMNLMGIRNSVVDKLVETVIYAPDREHLVTAVHALDRVLLNGEYVVPNWYIPYHRVAYWDRFEFPNKLPLYYDATGWAIMTWWANPAGVAR